MSPHLEPEARAAQVEHSGIQAIALYSIAISLKRIADALGDPHHSVAGMVEDAAFRAGVAFANGKRSAGG